MPDSSWKAYGGVLFYRCKKCQKEYVVPDDVFPTSLLKPCTRENSKKERTCDGEMDLKVLRQAR